MSARIRQKEATRNRVLEAARDLFETLGYQETTVRAIAARAGVSVGSVFTTYASKAEILDEVLNQHIDAFLAEMDRITPNLRGSTADRLRSIFAINLRWNEPHTRLILAHSASLFELNRRASASPLHRADSFRGLVKRCLAEGQVHGEVAADADLDQVTELLMCAFAWTYRLVIWQDADAEVLSRQMDRHIGVVLAGVAPVAARDA